jgi:tetratricopeptide (TPR) repeat protein
LTFPRIPAIVTAMSLIAYYASRLFWAKAGIPLGFLFVKFRKAPVLDALLTMALLLCLGSSVSRGAEASAPAPTFGSIEETNLQQLLIFSTRLQEQLQALRLAVEKDRHEAKAAATQNTEAVLQGLQALQEALSAQRTREFENLQQSNLAMERSNRAMLLMAGTVAAIGFLALLIMTWFQWRTGNKLAGLSAAWSMPGLAVGSGPPALGPGDAVEQANARLLGAIGQLDQRLIEFKRVLASGSNGDSGAGSNHRSATAASSSAQDPQITGLLQQANALLSSDNAEGALACFEEVLTLAPNHGESLVKKGALLERMHRLNEAIECYDRAIAADSSLTLAYLHKGGLCNRLERFKEALDCYEKALRTHEQRGNSI